MKAGKAAGKRRRANRCRATHCRAASRNAFCDTCQRLVSEMQRRADAVLFPPAWRVPRVPPIAVPVPTHRGDKP